MWNRRKEEEPTARPTGAAASTVGGNEGMPMQTTPSRFDHDAPPAPRTATIGKGVSITGQIWSKEDLIIDGEVDGTIEAADHKVTIGPNGKVKATIKSKDIVVIGAVQGNVEAAEKIDIKKDARLFGDIKTARISIEDGAIFKGSIDIIRNETPKPAAKPQPTAAAPATQQTLAASAGGSDPKR
ncbi:MAG: polymer-forming cytoskeletal protein [Acidobacteria bacterium]|nr:polymer-forming cytoskeletal protein [Acidobacteriota bacterium]